MREILALAGKDLRLLFRDKAGFFFVLFFPLLYAIFFGVIFSGEGGGSSAIPVAVVDEDSSESSAKFAKTLTDAEELDVLQTSRDEAVALVRQGKRSAYLVLRKGFGVARERLFWGDPAEVEIGVDPARKAEAAMLKGLLTGYYMQGIQEVFSDPSRGRSLVHDGLSALDSVSADEMGMLAPLSRSLKELDQFLAQVESTGTTVDSAGGGVSQSEGWNPLVVEVNDVAVKREGPKNAFEVTFPQAILWAMLGCAAAFGISLVTERTRGTLVRLRMAPLSRRQILAGNGLACFSATVMVTVLLFVLSFLIFNVRPYSLTFLALAIVASALCFVGVMMLLSVVGKTEASAGGIGWAVLIVMAMTGGGMIPLFFMPSWMKTLSSISPVKWAILTLEGAVWRGFTLEQMLLHSAILVAIGALCFAVGAKVFSWTEG